MTWTSGPPYGGSPQAGAAPAGRPPGVTGAAIGLIVAGAASFVSGVIWMAAGLSTINDNGGFQGASDALADAIVFSPILSVFLAPATIIGGVQMLRRSTRGLVMVGAIASVVPLSSCCILVGLPFGIWALLVLRRPDVRAWFAYADDPADTPSSYPPAPGAWY